MRRLVIGILLVGGIQAIRIAAVALLFTLSVSLRTDALTANRKALIIANSHYAHTALLPNPPSDAALIGQHLEALGFAVEVGTDVTAQQFSDLLKNFASSLDSSTTVFFYYAGHGIQYHGENFLVGVDAQLANDDSIKSEAFPLSAIIDKLEQGAETTLMFWDACRENPLAGGPFGSGAAIVPARSKNTLIMFSASPNHAAIDGNGTNSPFAEALANHIADLDDVETVLKRVAVDVSKATHSAQMPDRQSTQLNEFVYLNTQAPEARSISQEYSRNNLVIAAVSQQQSPRKFYSIAGRDDGMAMNPRQPSPNRDFVSERPVDAVLTASLQNATVIRRTRISPDGSLLALGGDDGVIRIVNLETFAVMETINAHICRVRDLDFSPDSHQLLSVGSDGHAYLWRLSDGSLAKEILEVGDTELYSGRINPLAPDKFVLIGDRKGFLYAKDLKHNRLITHAKFHNGPVLAVSYQPHGKGTYLSAGGDGHLKIRLPEGQRIDLTADDKTAVDKAIFQADYTPTGDLIYTAGNDRKVKIWDAYKLGSAPVRILEAHKKYVLAASSSLAGDILASGGGDKVVNVWSLASGQLMAQLVGHTSDVEAVTFTHDSRYVISSSEDKSLRIWSLNNRETLLRMFFQNGGQHYVGLTYDNRAFGDLDSGLITVRVDGKEVSQEDGQHYIKYLGRGISITEH
jgi:WD40 repeat protein